MVDAGEDAPQQSNWNSYWKGQSFCKTKDSLTMRSHPSWAMGFTHPVFGPHSNLYGKVYGRFVHNCET